MSSRKRKQYLRNLRAKIAREQKEAMRPFYTIKNLIEQNGPDEEIARVIKEAVDGGYSLHYYVDWDCVTLLHIAAQYNRPKAIHQLITEAGLDVDAMPADRKKHDALTPLFDAVCFGSVEAAKMLINLGADLSIKNTISASLLHWAVWRIWRYGEEKCFQLVKVLLDAGLDPHAKDRDGLEPINWFQTKDLQRKFLKLIKEKTDGDLPQRWKIESKLLEDALMDGIYYSSKLVPNNS